MSNLKIWASTVGFKSFPENIYRGSVHTDHLSSIQSALESMGLTCVRSKPNFEIWVSENDNDVVLINHSTP